MSTHDKLTRTELAARYFACKHCGAAGEVVFRAEGVDWVSDSLDDGVDPRAAVVAEAELLTDATRTQGLIKCPSCEQRAAGASRWAGIRIGCWLALGVPFVIFGGEALVGAAGTVAMAIVQALRERGRFARADRATIHKLTPGKVRDEEAPSAPKPVIRRQLAPTPELPVARVVHAAVVAVHEEPDPTAPPRFLRDPNKED